MARRMARCITVQDLLRSPHPEYVSHAAAARSAQCVTLGELTVTFESRPTVLALLHDIVETEGVSDPDALQAECDVYNALLPVCGLSASVALDGDAMALRGQVEHLQGLERRLWLVIGDAAHLAEFPGPMAARQHVRFALDTNDVSRLADPEVLVTLRSDHPHHRHEVALSAALRRRLVEDLAWDA